MEDRIEVGSQVFFLRRLSNIAKGVVTYINDDPDAPEENVIMVKADIPELSGIDTYPLNELWVVPATGKGLAHLKMIVVDFINTCVAADRKAVAEADKKIAEISKLKINDLII